MSRDPARDPVAAELDAAPDDDEELSDEDLRAVREAREEPSVPWSEAEAELSASRWLRGRVVEGAHVGLVGGRVVGGQKVLDLVEAPFLKLSAFHRVPPWASSASLGPSTQNRG